MKRVIFAISVLCLFTTLAVAQSTNGTLAGNVSGPDGLLPGVTVTATDNQTNKTLTTTTNSSGGYKFEQLNFGTYTVRVTSDGFKTFVATDVKIDVSREYSLNPKLELGDVAAEVTVQAGAETINTSNAELSSTISQEQIKELPLNGRNPLSLLNLTAGANPTSNSINGQRSSSQDIRRDGLNVQDNFIRSGAFVQDVPTVDDTAEFTVTTQNAGVEQGGGSTQIQLVTPRGGSEYHGAAYIFNRNSAFTANSFFNNARDVEKPFLNRNQFGGSFSGPLPLPNFGTGGPLIKNDKSFFFFNYEGFRLAQQVSTSATTLLPIARDGTFTYTTATGLRTVNVLTGQNFATPLTTAQGGALTVDPIIQSRILSQLPTSGNGTTTGTNFTQVVNFNQSNPEERNAYVARVDYQANDKNTLGFVYKRNNNSDARTDIRSGFSTTPFVNQGGPTNFFVANYQITPTNNFSNEVRGGFNYSEPFFQESNVPSDFLIGNLQIISDPLGNFRSQGRTTSYRNIQDNAVYTLGNHSIRFGGQAEFYKVNSVNFRGITPTFSILGGGNQIISGLDSAQLPGINSADLARANSLRFLLGGIIGSGSRTANLTSIGQGFEFAPSSRRVNYDLYAGYVSDQWRVRPNLTLNFGLRYEYYTPLEAPDRLFLEPVIADPNNIAASILDPNGRLDIIGGNTGNPNTFTNPDRNNFAPSFSFAYSPKFENGLFSKLIRSGTTIRGGFRINYVNDEYIKAVSTLVGANRGLGSFDVQALNPATGTNVIGASLTPRPGFDPLPVIDTAPTLGANAFPISFAQNNADVGFGSQVFGVDPNLQVQRTMEYNLGIQFALPYKSVLEVRYVGGQSDDLVRTTTFNQLDITDNGFLEGFRIARQNCAIQGRTTTAGATAFDPSFFCTNANNIGLAGQRDNPVFDQLFAGGVLNQAQSPSIFSTVRAFLSQNRAGSLAQYYNNTRLSNGAFLRGDVQFFENPNIFVDEILGNAGKYRYNALQAEVRRRFSNGFSYQVNYTFQKTLSNVPDEGQNRQGEIQDNGNPDLDYGRTDYDRTHTVNANMIYELPFGRGKRFLNQGGFMDKVFGGFQFTSIVNLSSGPPLSILDPRSTSTITFQSDRQRALSNLTDDEIKNLFGVFNTPNGIYTINPRVLFATARNDVTRATQRIDLTQPLPAGFTLVSVRATSPINEAPFPEQVFFFNEAGQVGNLPLNFINGLPYLNWDAGLSKSIRFAEKYKLQFRVEVFNLLNNQVPFFGSDLNIDSNNFGEVTSTYNTPRILQFGFRFDF